MEGFTEIGKSQLPVIASAVCNFPILRTDQREARSLSLSLSSLSPSLCLTLFLVQFSFLI